MSKPNSGSGLHQQQEFQRKNSPYAASGPANNRRPSLQRRILSTGVTQSAIQAEESSGTPATVGAQKAADALGPSESAAEHRTMNLLKLLPPAAQEKIPAGVLQLFTWPHPAFLWARLVAKSAGARGQVAALFKKAGTSTVGLFQRMGGAISTMTYKMLERSAVKASQMREKMPRMSELKKKLPGSRQFGQLMERTLDKLSDAMDRKVRQHALRALRDREVAFATGLDANKSCTDFINAFVANADPATLFHGNADLIPTAMRQQRPNDVPELLAHKLFIPQQYPALAQCGLDLQLRTLGYLLTSRFAQQKGKNMDRASVDFANLVAMSLQDADQIVQFIEDVRLKWKLFNEDNTTRLTQAALGSLGQGLIAKDTFQAVNATVRSFLRLPPE